MTMSPGHDGRIGVDIGGTFTDIVLARGDGRLLVHKISSTTAEPERAVVAGIVDLLRRADDGGRRGSSRSCTAPRSAPTPSCSAAAPRTGLITTRGFRDVLEIGRIRTPDMFDLDWDKPKPLVRAPPSAGGRRAHRRRRQRRRAARRGGRRRGRSSCLVAEGIEAVAICFINSYRNPAHEQRGRARSCARRFPGIAVIAPLSPCCPSARNTSAPAPPW